MAQLLQYLPVSYDFLTNLSEDASSLIQQNMMANELSTTSSAGEAASGNFSLANMHFSTHNANNTSANYFDTTVVPNNPM